MQYMTLYSIKMYMINCYITLDYELFMGARTGSINNSLIKPMTELDLMLDKYNIRTNLFVDSAYLLRLKQLKDTNEGT